MASKTGEAKLRNADSVLVALKMFLDEDVEEVSLPELTECVAELGKSSIVSYSFPKGLFYSYELFEDLRNLEYRGTMHTYECRHDGYLPKTYYRLTMLGQGVAERLLGKLSEEQKGSLQNAVLLSITSNQRRWRLVRRKKSRTLIQ